MAFNYLIAKLNFFIFGCVIIVIKSILCCFSDLREVT